MSILIADYQAVQTLSVTGLASLANGNTVVSTAQASADWTDTLIRVQITASVDAAANGFVSIAVRGSIDGADYDDANNERVIATIVLPASGAQSRSITFLLGGAEPLPPFWMLSFSNATGAALSAAAIQYRGIRTKTTGETVVIPVSAFTTTTGDGTTSLNTAANSMTIAFGTTATSLRGAQAGLTVGKRYRVSWSMASSNGTQGQMGAGTSLGGPQYRPTLSGAAGTNTFDFDATQDTVYLTFQRASAGSTTFSELTILEIPSVSWAPLNPQPITPATWTALSSGAVTVNGTTGAITIAATGTLISAAGSITTEIGKLYRLAWTVGTNTIACPIGTAQGGSTLKSNSVTHAVGAHTYEFTATTTSTWIQFQRQTSGTAVVSGIALQEIENSSGAFSDGFSSGFS